MSDDRLTRIEDKIDHVVDKIGNIDVTLAKQHEQLEYHIKRTDLLEKSVKPIETHVTMIHGVLKAIGILAIGAGIAQAAVAVLEYLRR